MRKILFTALLLMGVMLSGCSQEKAQVETYLKDLKASNDAMKATAGDMEKSMSGLQDEIRSGNFDAEKIKAQIGSFADKMKVEKTKLEGVNVPEKAKTLHDTTVNQYDVAIKVLGKTPGMVDIAKKMSEAAKKLRADPKKQKEILAELKGYQDEMMVIQAEVGKLAEEGKGLDTTAKAEKKKLQDEFQIPADPTPGAAATPGAAGGTPAPAASATPAKP